MWQKRKKLYRNISLAKISSVKVLFKLVINLTDTYLTAELNKQ